MNWLLIVVVLIIAACVYNGYQKGFLRIVFSMVSWIVVLLMVSFFTPHIHLYLMENTMLNEKIEQHCEDFIRQKVAEKASEEGVQDSSYAIVMPESNEAEQKTNLEILLDQLGIILPSAAVDTILSKTVQTADGIMQESGLYTPAAQGMTDFIMEGISFFLSFMAAELLCRVPGIKGANRFLGVFAGLIKGFLITWIGFYLISLFSYTQTGQELIAYIYESEFLTVLYEKNLLIILITHLFS